jgi:hypothetical protein
VPPSLRAQLQAQLGVASGCLVFLVSVAWAGCVYYGRSSLEEADEECGAGGRQGAGRCGTLWREAWSEAGVQNGSGTRRLAQMLLLACLPLVMPLVGAERTAAEHGGGPRAEPGARAAAVLRVHDTARPPRCTLRAVSGVQR